MLRFNFPGDIHFVTFRTFKACPIFKDEKCCELFLENLEYYRKKYNLKIPGYVILWEHIHLLIWFDMDKFTDLTISKIMHGIKGYSSKLIYEYLKSKKITGRQGSYALPGLNQGSGALATKERRVKIWQPSFYDFNINTEKKFWEKLNYIHNNPIRHGLTDDISQYKFCSWRNYELDDQSIFKIDVLDW